MKIIPNKVKANLVPLAKLIVKMWNSSAELLCSAESRGPGNEEAKILTTYFVSLPSILMCHRGIAARDFDLAWSGRVVNPLSTQRHSLRTDLIRRDSFNALYLYQLMTNFC